MENTTKQLVPFSTDPICGLINPTKASIMVWDGCGFMRRDKYGQILTHGFENIKTDSECFFGYGYWYFKRPLYIECEIRDCKEIKKISQNQDVKYCSLKLRYTLNNLNSYEYYEENTKLAKQMFLYINKLYEQKQSEK